MALRWLTGMAREARKCVATRSFVPADDSMGDGPFRVNLRGATASLVGQHVFRGLREIWVRDVYLGGGFLSIPDGSTVVDLGANMGNFTLLALGHGPRVRVVSVEASETCVAKLRRSLAANGWDDRAQVIHAFIIGEGVASLDLQGAQAIHESQLIGRAALKSVDFLKCDIEGSEFGLLGPDSRLLRMARQIAMEVHRFGGAPADDFPPMLRSVGFEVQISQVGEEGFTILGRRPEAHAGVPAGGR
jgi:hypothetical protein